jgi:AcrR family transcriptional regulator
MPTKPKKPLDGSTEARIKEAARKLFTQKGFAAVKTRDIAAEAGINLALLNYYFRSKQKLFDMIMLENMQQFIKGIALIFEDGNASIEQKLESVVSSYIDMLIKNPDLPLFILQELRNNPDKIGMVIQAGVTAGRNAALAEVFAAMERGEIAKMHPVNFMANLIGLTVFPFIGRPILQKVSGVNDEQFLALMEERKKLVPIWLKAILKPE